MIPYTVVTIVCIILSLIFNVLFMFIPSVGIFILSFFVRQHIVRRYNIIDGGGACNECMTSCCCYTCSLAQSKNFVFCIIFITSVLFSFIFIVLLCYSVFHVMCCCTILSGGVGWGIVWESSNSIVLTFIIVSRTIANVFAIELALSPPQFNAEVACNMIDC
jgi:PLAC8 family